MNPPLISPRSASDLPWISPDGEGTGYSEGVFREVMTMDSIDRTPQPSPSPLHPQPSPSPAPSPSLKTTLQRSLGILSGLGILCLGAWTPVRALPGETVQDVEAWIRAHPTLLPAPGETLRVRKQNTAAQRFTYEASMWAPGRLTSETNWGLIRSESITLFDVVNGITPDRLEESLRVIHGLDIYQDYQRAALVYSYPQPIADPRLRAQLTPLQLARQGELRLGDRYAYWIEVVQNPDGSAYNGTITVFLKEDLTKLEAELRQ